MTPTDNLKLFRRGMKAVRESIEPWSSKLEDEFVALWQREADKKITDAQLARLDQLTQMRKELKQ